jgi:hypothetical protein
MVSCTGAVASIGDSVDCEFGSFAVAANQQIEGVSAQDAIDRVNRLETTVVWGDGSTSAVSMMLVADGSPVCATFDFFPKPADALLTVAAALHVASQDGRLDATWPGTMTVAIAEQGRSVQVELSRYLPPLSPADFEREYGIHGIDGSGYDTLGASLDLHGDLATSLSATLTVSGDRPCMRQKLSDGGVDCTGGRVDLEQATLTSRSTGAAPGTAN